MRRSLLCAGVLLAAATARAEDGPFLQYLQRCAQRTPLPRRPVEHTAQRAGYPLNIAPWAQPSVTCRDYVGYVGGATLKGNSLWARGPGSATGPLLTGTAGMDYGGLRGHLGRVFLAPSTDPSRGYPFSWNYLAEGPRIVDVGMLRPVRKAVLEMRHDAEEREHGGHGHGEGEHGEGEHGAGGGHGPEGAPGAEGAKGQGGNH